MKKRLRKKLRLGEFQELGFEVRAELRERLSPDELEAFLDRWIDAVEARGLAFGGGGGPGTRFDGFVQRARRGSASEEDRQALAALLDADADVVRHEIGPLTDAWHGFPD